MLSSLIISMVFAEAPERHWVQTDDNGWIALHRRQSAGPAVVLCHGISSNHRFWDLEPGRSLSGYLHDRGYDVWNLDLRGHGDAETDPEGKRQKPGWTLDTYGGQDLPAAFAYVQKHSGAEDLVYVGHSMGGMVLAAYLGQRGQKPLTAAVLLGTPLDFRDPDWVFRTAFGALPLASALPSLPSPWVAKLMAPFRRATFLDFDELVLNPDNVAPAAEALALRTVVSPLTSGELAHFERIHQAGDFVSFDGTVNYREALGGVQLPTLFIAGRADRIVSPDRVWAYYEALGTEDKRWFIASRSNGLHGDYGHLDLGIGDHVEEDVFPEILAWLEAH